MLCFGGKFEKKLRAVRHQVRNRTAAEIMLNAVNVGLLCYVSYGFTLEGEESEETAKSKENEETAKSGAITVAW